MMATSTRVLALCLLVLLYIQGSVILGATVATWTDHDALNKSDVETKADLNENQLLAEVMKLALHRTTMSEGVSCPPPFIRVMEECFYIHVVHRLTWWDALGFCLDMGGHLAQPTHTAALQAVILQNYRNGPHHFWLGASDVKKEGVFRWLSGALVDSGWREKQPDDATEGEDCLEMWPLKYPSLNDRNCHIAQAFVCQY